MIIGVKRVSKLSGVFHTQIYNNKGIGNTKIIVLKDTKTLYIF